MTDNTSASSSRFSLGAAVLAVVLIAALSAAMAFGVLPGRTTPPNEEQRSLPAAPDAGRPDSTDSPVDRGRNLDYPEVAQLAAALKQDPARLLRFVADEVAFEPYAGALRGPRGALLARRANAVDKALLLRDLLRFAGPEKEIRFAFGTLPDDEARALVLTAVNPPSRATARNAAEVDALRDSLRAKLDAAVWDELERIGADWTGLTASVVRNADALTALLRRENVKVAPPPPAIDRLAGIVKRHAWLQYRQGDRWIDLDPTIPAAAEGQRRCPPDSIAAGLPEDLYHHLSVNVFVEQRQAGSLSTRVLLESDWRTADLVGSAVTYAHAEILGLEDVAAEGVSDSQNHYTPVLLIDDERVVGDRFVLPRPASMDVTDAVAAGARGLGERMGGMLAGAERRPGKAAADNEPVITALWLQLVLSAPDQAPEISERPIFDRIGYAARESRREHVATLSPIESADGDYPALRTIWNVATGTGERVVPAALEAVDDVGRDTLIAALGQLGQLHRTYYVIRDALLNATGSDSQSLRSGADVSLLSVTGGTGSAAAEFKFVLDLLMSHVQPVGRDAGLDTTPARWAHASLAAESFLFRQPRVSADDSVMGEQPRLAPDVGSVFTQAERENVRTRVLRPADLAGIQSLDVSEEARARLRTRLARNQTVVVPERAVDVSAAAVTGWWIVDPDRGFILDEMENGGHQSGTEHSLTTKQSKEKATVAGRGYGIRFLRGVLCSARVCQVLIGGVNFTTGLETGNPVLIEQGMKDVLDGVRGAAQDCGAVKPKVPAPTAQPGRDPANPAAGTPVKFPRPTNTKPPRGPYLPKRPPFRGLPRGR